RQRVFRHVAADVAALAATGAPVTVVSSGAIALGLGARGHTSRPRRLAELQAASAIGQSLLLRRWESALRRHGVGCAQVLLHVGEVRDHRLLADMEVDGASSSWGSGGMRSKVVAAEMASTGGVAAVIASGHRPGALLAAAAGEPGGTRFPADARPMPAYKLWV